MIAFVHCFGLLKLPSRGAFFIMKLEDILKKKKSKVRRSGVLIGIGLALTLLFSLSAGKADIGVGSILRVLAGNIAGAAKILEPVSPAHRAIIWEIRLPRIITAVVVGGGLALTGAVFQSLLMNPLADSYTMGISSGAAFGASIAIYLNLFIAGLNLPVTLFAFAGAFLTLLLVMSIARVNNYLSPINMVLAGIIVSSILYAAVSFLKSASGEKVGAIVTWLLGSLAARNWRHVFISLPVVGVGSAVCIYFSRDLNILSMGDRESKSLGINAQKLRRIFLISGSLITAACVSVSGIIGFVGLVVPHMLRLAVGSDNRILVPMSALLGALLLLLADTAARVILNVEVPVGVLTTLLGGPFFIYLFVKRNRTLQ
jgi:iron complex transport system permease protein